jgi:ABC-type Co2+ transport system permease subunit
MLHPNRRRLSTALLAPIAALAAWALVRLAGIDLVVSGGTTIGAADVVVASLLGALGGWVVVRLLERRSTRPRHWWAFIGSTALAVSMIGPSWRADGASAVALMGLHLVVAVVVILGFVDTLPVGRDCAPQHSRQLPRRDPAA